MRMPRRLVTLGLVLALAAIPAAPAAAGGGYTITDLGTFGGTYSVASAVNDNGIVVGQAEYPNGDAHAFLYGGALPLTDLMTLGGSFSDATDVNSNKEVVGDAADSADHDQSFRWPGGGSLQLIPTLGGLGGFALAVNDDGVIVGDANTATGELHVYMYDGSLTDVSLLLAPLGATFSVVADINAAKEVVGQAVLSGFVHARAFRWTPGHQAELLGTLPGGSEAGARAVNDNGEVVGNSNSGVAADFHAVAWDAAGSITDLGSLGGSNATAEGVNEAGQVVGSSSTATTDLHAFLYTGGTMTDLNTLLRGGSPWLLDQAKRHQRDGPDRRRRLHRERVPRLPLDPEHARRHERQCRSRRPDDRNVAYHAHLRERHPGRRDDARDERLRSEPAGRLQPRQPADLLRAFDHGFLLRFYRGVHRLDRHLVPRSADALALRRRDVGEHDDLGERRDRVRVGHLVVAVCALRRAGGVRIPPLPAV